MTGGIEKRRLYGNDLCDPREFAHWQEKAKPNVMALGFFDGIHNGHCEVIKTGFTEGKGKELALSSDEFLSPSENRDIVMEKSNLHYLMPPSQKEKMLPKLGVDTFYFVEIRSGICFSFTRTICDKYLIRSRCRPCSRRF